MQSVKKTDSISLQPGWPGPVERYSGSGESPVHVSFPENCQVEGVPLEPLTSVAPLGGATAQQAEAFHYEDKPFEWFLSALESVDLETIRRLAGNDETLKDLLRSYGANVAPFKRCGAVSEKLALGGLALGVAGATLAGFGASAAAQASAESQGPSTDAVGGTAAGAAMAFAGLGLVAKNLKQRWDRGGKSYAVAKAEGAAAYAKDLEKCKAARAARFAFPEGEPSRSVSETKRPPPADIEQGIGESKA